MQCLRRFVGACAAVVVDISPASVSSAIRTSVTVTPHRIIRDTLSASASSAPYASDAASVAAVAKAAPTGPADEILALFCLTAGCAYDCAHRKTCDFPVANVATVSRL